jgi:catechol-2,3-dioxygenase
MASDTAFEEDSNSAEESATADDAPEDDAAAIDGICEMTLQARDPGRLAEFYALALGCEEIAREPDRVWLACGERARLGIWSPGSKEFGDRGGVHVHFALSCRPGAVEGMRRRLAALGVSHRGPIEHEGGDRSLYLEDPEGNVVEIWDFFRRPEGEEQGVRALT